MFYNVRLKLTLQYSIIFLILFWGISFGIYFWMNRYFGDHGEYNSIRVNYENAILQNNLHTHEPVSDIIMDELRNVLMIVDVLLLFGIPTVLWLLTTRTLAPIQAAHEREKQFLTDASHDLRIPLSILHGELELILHKDQSKQVYKKILQSNKEEVDDLIALVENMLFFAWADKKEQQVLCEEVDMTDMIAERVSLFQKIAKQKNLKLIFHFPKKSILIYGDKNLLKRLLTSLLDNAIKYTGAGGEVAIKITEEKNSIIMIIADTGIGISREQHERVFDRFFRGDTSRNEKGYGLGLSIAKQIVALHHGKISLESKVAKGTTIILSFPLFNKTQKKSLS